ncbi:MAG: SUMF1/EgtB/PvdO family nonheme iron enzyme, partial [Candidatus Eisenbacteria bacterium]|nr:SUMF1/EgtB/PvdO family nonheme iron enzyme [Candidatus Eisenbacteria bacterium]
VAAGQSGLQVVDITDPDRPELILWLDTPKFANAIAVARTYDADGSVRDLAFLVEGTEGILPYDITLVPDTLIDLRQGTSAYAGAAVCVALPEFATDSYELYLADSWRAVTGFVSNPANPGFLDQRARVVPYGYTQDLALEETNTYLYVADDQMGVTVVDVSRVYERELTVIGNVDTPGYALGIAVAHGFVYVADGTRGLQIMRIGEDHLPQPISSLALPGRCQSITVHEGVAFIAARDAGLYIIDVSDPYRPRTLGNVPSPSALSVAVSSQNIVCVADATEGLIVLRGPTRPADIWPPAAIDDLAARLSSTTAVELSWTAPGDDGRAGTAERYDLRWSPAPITEASWAAATDVIRRPIPREAGTRQHVPLDGLAAGQTYYFAMKTIDEAGLVSELSNVAVARMTAPSLTSPSVDPDVGTPTTPFTYSVIYADPEGDPPAVRRVLIDGELFDMEPVGSSWDFTAGVVYRYQTTLGFGSHEYQFRFDDGHGPLVTTPSLLGPDVPEGDPFDFVLVTIRVGEGATFTMGSPAGELGRDDDETPHEVTLTRDYAIGATEVTQYLYTAVMGTNPAYFRGSSRPVEGVTWFDAVLFCNALSANDGLQPAYTISGQVLSPEGRVIAAAVTWDPLAEGYRLPTEAEWEYACRAGSTTSLANGPLTRQHCQVDPLLDEMGWYCGNSDPGTGPKTRDTGQKAPNAFGLHDMHGNVWEWCWDRYAAYPSGPVADPAGPAGENWEPHVRRGGSWFYFARDCRSASRDLYWPGSQDNTLGFRVARNAR